MASAILILSFVTAVASFIAFVMIVIAAFDDELWKGLLGFFVPIYLLYWAIVEDYGPGKWPKIIIWTAGGVLTIVLRVAYVYMAVAQR